MFKTSILNKQAFVFISWNDKWIFTSNPWTFVFRRKFTKDLKYYLLHLSILNVNSFKDSEVGKWW